MKNSKPLDGKHYNSEKLIDKSGVLEKAEADLDVEKSESKENISDDMKQRFLTSSSQQDCRLACKLSSFPSQFLQSSQSCVTPL